MLTRCKEHAHRHSSRDVLIPKCSHFVCSRHLRSSAGDECPTLWPDSHCHTQIITTSERQSLFISVMTDISIRPGKYRSHEGCTELGCVRSKKQRKNQQYQVEKYSLYQWQANKNDCLSGILAWYARDKQLLWVSLTQKWTIYKRFFSMWQNNHFSLSILLNIVL